MLSDDYVREGHTYEKNLSEVCDLTCHIHVV